jgi:hypothetical protein
VNRKLSVLFKGLLVLSVSLSLAHIAVAGDTGGSALSMTESAGVDPNAPSRPEPKRLSLANSASGVTEREPLLALNAAGQDWCGTPMGGCFAPCYTGQGCGCYFPAWGGMTYYPGTCMYLPPYPG